MADEKILNTVRRVLANVERSRETIAAAYRVKGELIGLALENAIAEADFYRASSLLTPQARSPLWERYFIRRHQCRKVAAKSDSGDFEKDGVYYEYKASGYNQDDAVHIVQIRLWQGCDYVVQSVSDAGATSFLLTHSEMGREVALCKGTSAHGTRTAIADNKNVEKRVTLHKDSEHWARWAEKYVPAFRARFLAGILSCHETRS